MKNVFLILYKNFFFSKRKLLIHFPVGKLFFMYIFLIFNNYYVIIQESAFYFFFCFPMVRRVCLALSVLAFFFLLEKMEKEEKENS